jgi:hypothetical protein
MFDCHIFSSQKHSSLLQLSNRARNFFSTLAAQLIESSQSFVGLHVRFQAGRKRSHVRFQAVANVHTCIFQAVENARFHAVNGHHDIKYK